MANAKGTKVFIMDTKDIAKQVINIANETAKVAQKYIRQYAKDTGDLERSITVGKAKRSQGKISVEVFADTTKLYSKRKAKKPNRLYPVYVHEGTRKMRARPFFTIATKFTRSKFQNITPTLKVTK